MSQPIEVIALERLAVAVHNRRYESIKLIDEDADRLFDLVDDIINAAQLGKGHQARIADAWHELGVDRRQPVE